MIKKGCVTIKDKAKDSRSVKVIERKLDTALGTITYKIKIDNELYKYKTPEEIADMIETAINNEERNS